MANQAAHVGAPLAGVRSFALLHGQELGWHQRWGGRGGSCSFALTLYTSNFYSYMYLLVQIIRFLSSTVRTHERQRGRGPRIDSQVHLFV